jgi:hypothetical protein
LLEVDQLSVQIYVEYQEAVDIHEALWHENLLNKEHIQNASHFWWQTLNPFPTQVT